MTSIITSTVISYYSVTHPSSSEHRYLNDIDMTTTLYVPPTWSPLRISGIITLIVSMGSFTMIQYIAYKFRNSQRKMKHHQFDITVNRRKVKPVNEISNVVVDTTTRRNISDTSVLLLHEQSIPSNHDGNFNNGMKNHCHNITMKRSHKHGYKIDSSSSSSSSSASIHENINDEIHSTIVSSTNAIYDAIQKGQYPITMKVQDDTTNSSTIPTTIRTKLKKKNEPRQTPPVAMTPTTTPTTSTTLTISSSSSSTTTLYHDNNNIPNMEISEDRHTNITNYITIIPSQQLQSLAAKQPYGSIHTSQEQLQQPHFTILDDDIEALLHETTYSRRYRMYDIHSSGNINTINTTPSTTIPTTTTTSSTNTEHRIHNCSPCRLDRYMNTRQLVIYHPNDHHQHPYQQFHSSGSSNSSNSSISNHNNDQIWNQNHDELMDTNNDTNHHHFPHVTTSSFWLSNEDDTEHTL